MPVSSEMLRLTAAPAGTEACAAGVVLATLPLETKEKTWLDVLPTVRWLAARI